MFQTSDFSEWLFLGNLPSEQKDAAALVVAASGKSAKPYKATWPGPLRIKGPTGDSLLLYTDRSRAAFKAVAASYLKRFDQERVSELAAESLFLQINRQSRSDWEQGLRGDWAEAA